MSNVGRHKRGRSLAVVPFSFRGCPRKTNARKATYVANFLGGNVIKLLYALLALAALSGCATKEGIRLPTSKPTQDDVGDFNRRNTPSPNAVPPTSAPHKETVKTSLIPEVQGTRLIIVGNAMALTVFDEATLNQRYDNYLKQRSVSMGLRHLCELI